MHGTGLPAWLEWSRELQALAQTGLAFSTNAYDTARYQRVMEIAAHIVEGATGLHQTEVLESFLRQHGYATPKIDVRGAVVQDGKILLVWERSDQRWCMPGGWADVGEAPSDMVVREIREESGFEARPVRIIGVFDANRDGRPLEFYHAYKIVFLCEVTGGEPRPGDETSAVEFFTFDHLPPLSSSRTNERHLTEILAHLTDVHRSPAFD
jgi:ADP-ribose pyrophosphatase YjhB (NUDIX family)